jgi:hypothetical protein
MIMHKTNAHWEAGAKPTPEIIQQVGGMVGELVKAGILVAGEGLGPSSQGARVRLAKGQASVFPGPFDGEGALPSRGALFRAGTLEAAADAAARFGRIFGDVVVDVRPVNEPWDLGFAPKPDGLTTRRYMAVVHADPSSEAGAALSAGQRTALKAFSEDLGRTGAFLGVHHFEPSAKGKRLRPGTAAKGAPAAAQAKRSVLDGPFSETKELIGGFVIVETASIDEALGWAQKYLDVVETDEVDVRGLVETA